MLLKRRKSPQKPEAGCCSVWSVLKTINTKKNKKVTERFQPALKRQCRLQEMVDMCKVLRKVFLVVGTVLPGVDVTQDKTVQAPMRMNGTLTFSFFPVPFSICVISNSPIFPTTFLMLLRPFFCLSTRYSVCLTEGYAPHLFYSSINNNSSCSSQEMGLHCPVSLAV